MTNPAHAALTRAVNRAIAEGAPVYTNEPVPDFEIRENELGETYARALTDAGRARAKASGRPVRDWFSVPSVGAVAPLLAAQGLTYRMAEPARRAQRREVAQMRGQA